jgi:hypothetical protein
MSVLNYLLIALAIIIPGGIPLYLYWRWRTKKFNEAEEQLKKSINNFTDALVEAARDSLDAEIQETSTGVKYKTAKSAYLSDPQYLTTLLATIVKKNGAIKLSEEDFINVSKSDYVSLYVDMKTNDIILKSHNTDSSSGEVAPYVSAATDEDVFH